MVSLTLIGTSPSRNRYGLGQTVWGKLHQHGWRSYSNCLSMAEDLTVLVSTWILPVSDEGSLAREPSLLMVLTTKFFSRVKLVIPTLSELSITNTMSRAPQRFSQSWGKQTLCQPRVVNSCCLEHMDSSVAHCVESFFLFCVLCSLYHASCSVLGSKVQRCSASQCENYVWECNMHLTALPLPPSMKTALLLTTTTACLFDIAHHVTFLYHPHKLVVSSTDLE